MSGYSLSEPSSMFWDVCVPPNSNFIPLGRWLGGRDGVEGWW